MFKIYLQLYFQLEEMNSVSMEHLSLLKSLEGT